MDILFNSIKAKHLSKRGIIKFIDQFQREQLLLNTYYFARLLNAIERDGNEFVNGFGSKSNKIPIDILVIFAWNYSDVIIKKNQYL